MGEEQRREDCSMKMTGGIMKEAALMGLKAERSCFTSDGIKNSFMAETHQIIKLPKRPNNLGFT